MTTPNTNTDAEISQNQICNNLSGSSKIKYASFARGLFFLMPLVSSFWAPSSHATFSNLSTTEFKTSMVDDNPSGNSSEENALAEFESFLENRGLLKVQQYDVDAEKLNFYSSASNQEIYRNTITDPYYGYKIFILIDKSVSARPSKTRNGSVRQPQTMYIYEMDSQSGKLILTDVQPVSTGKEPSPGVSDTREGFMRIQSAQQTYTSRKYGEAMPFSLWFESEYGTAIHQTLPERCNSLIGKRASAGCIRLCPGAAESVFRRVTKYGRKHNIVLLDKVKGVPLKYFSSSKLASSDQEKITSPVSVIKGYPAFVRIIDGNTPQKVKELDNIVENPTEAFQKYFKPIDEDVINQLSM